MKDIVNQKAQFPAAGELNILLAEIQFQFQQRGHFQKLGPEPAQFFGITSFQLIHRYPVGGLVLGGNDIRNCFSLSEIHLAIHKSATGEFSRACRPCPGIQKQAYDGLDDVS